jgi:hypothetical protein
MPPFRANTRDHSQSQFQFLNALQDPQSDKDTGAVELGYDFNYDYNVYRNEYESTIPSPLIGVNCIEVVKDGNVSIDFDLTAYSNYKELVSTGILFDDTFNNMSNDNAVADTNAALVNADGYAPGSPSWLSHIVNSLLCMDRDSICGSFPKTETEAQSGTESGKSSASITEKLSDAYENGIYSFWPDQESKNTHSHNRKDFQGMTKEEQFYASKWTGHLPLGPMDAASTALQAKISKKRRIRMARGMRMAAVITVSTHD